MQKAYMTEDNLPQRTLKTTFMLVAFFTIVFVSRGQYDVSLGLILGGALGMFSLWSLAFAVPKLMVGNSFVSRFLLGLLMLMKLPIFAGSLFFAMASPLFSPFATFVGVAFTPMVIVCKVLAQQALMSPLQAAGE